MRFTRPSATLLTIVCAAFAPGDEPTRAARSVHLSYVAPSADAGYVAFYNECTIEKSVPGSYFQACGFAGGYFGVQELDDGKKIALFSVWDPTKGDDPDHVKKDDRVEILQVGADVRAQRFGGEGTGAQSLRDYEWQTGKRVRFFVQAWVSEQKTTYAAYIQSPDETTWKHMATFRTRSGKPMNRLYAFIEDFRRDTESAKQVRRARFGNAFVKTASGEWLALSQAKFTASAADWEARDTIDAGVNNTDFYLQTGGDTKTTSPLGTILSIAK